MKPTRWVVPLVLGPPTDESPAIYIEAVVG